MGRILLVGRLAVRDLRRRHVETALLLLAVLAATTTLTLGLVLRDAASDPYQTTRAATFGPDVVASVDNAADLAELDALAKATGVTDHSGPFPITGAELEASGWKSDVQAMGRDAAAASVDQPDVVDGTWVSDGGVVVEAAFASAFDVHVGDPVTVNGRSFTVVGLAASAAMAPWPGSSCIAPPGCASGVTDEKMAELPPGLLRNPGLIWLTRADIQDVATNPAYVMNLKLADPNGAQAFIETAGAPTATRPILRLEAWNEILAQATEVAGDSQIILMIGAWLLGLLAVASLSVLVGGRMADQTRRVGLLKAVGGTPALVAAVLLAEYVLVALVAAAAGIAVGTLTAPLLTERSAGLVGSAGTPSLTLSTVLVVTAVALAVAVVATFVPALRAARVSTIDALADAARPPRRTGWLIAVSAKLPVPLLLALRVAARRPRRAVLAVASIAVTVSGIFVVLILNAFLAGSTATGEYDAVQVTALRRVLLVWTVILLGLAAVNAVVITWTTVLDNRHASALTRALGATPNDVTMAMAAAQVLPALVGAVLGVFPGGYLLLVTITTVTGGDTDRVTLPSVWQLALLVLVTVSVVAALTALPARLGGRRPVTETL
jgi:ABC-type lipoprotein release transport system permease subunit